MTAAAPAKRARKRRVSDFARVALAAIRIFNGALALGAPQVLTRRLDAEPTGVNNYAFRLFGVRTVLIGFELLTRDPELRAKAVRAAVPIHATDTASVAFAGLRGELPPGRAKMLLAISGTNTLLALVARRGLR